MSIYNLIEYRDQHSKKFGNLQQYYRNKPFLIAKSAIADIPADSNNSSLFKFRTKIAGRTGNDKMFKCTKNIKIMVPLKYLSNFLEDP